MTLTGQLKKSVKGQELSKEKNHFDSGLEMTSFSPITVIYLFSNVSLTVEYLFMYVCMYVCVRMSV